MYYKYLLHGENVLEVVYFFQHTFNANGPSLSIDSNKNDLNQRSTKKRNDLKHNSYYCGCCFVLCVLL